MAKLLVPVDGSENALRAVDFVIQQARQAPDTELHVLNVQPPIISGAVKQFVDKATIDQYYQAEARDALKAALERLDQAKVPYTRAERVGPVAETIAKYVQDEDIGHVVMGTRGLSAMSGFWLGSVTTKTLHLIQVPVTLIK
ncbi:universal stress protein [Orrella sp. JC864]|uniref:universal stress protein n=1 Tax=Orrella sp. JC864 TaxID=3120298 RepID=UPI0012BCC4C7